MGRTSLMSVHAHFYLSKELFVYVSSFLLVFASIEHDIM